MKGELIWRYWNELFSIKITLDIFNQFGKKKILVVNDDHE